MPAGFLFDTAWLPDGYIYYDYSPDLQSDTQIWRIGRGKPAQRLRPPALRGCRRTEYLRPHRLPDGRLGLARLCDK